MSDIRKKLMICFYKGDINENINILEDFDSKGFEVHLFDNLDETNLNYDRLLYIINDLCGDKIDQYNIYISSNIKEFIMLEYVLYKNWISGALYINNNPVHIKLDGLYKEILNKEMFIEAPDFYLLKDEKNIFSNYKIFKEAFEQIQNEYKPENKLYVYLEKIHIFSLNSSGYNSMVKLDNSISTNNYIYHADLDYVDEYIDFIKYYSNSIEEFIKTYGSIVAELDKFKNKILNLPCYEKNIVKFKLENSLFNDTYNDSQKIFLSSALLDIFKDRKYFEFLLNLLIETTEINKYNRFFAYNQCIRCAFINKDVNNRTTDALIEKLYEKIYEEFATINKSYIKVPKEQRNENVVFVVTDQLLGVNHAPTKVTLDVCYNLMKNLNKQVLLINTKEVLTSQGIIAMGNISFGNEVKEYDMISLIEYKDEKIHFYQAKGRMPNEDEIINILNTVQEYKPNMIINIGTTLVGELCTKIIPTIIIPTGDDGYSKATFYVVDDKNKYEKYIEKHSRNKDSLIISKIQFELNPKKSDFTREQLGIPKNKFILAVIGNRLNEEIDEKFLNALDKSCEMANGYVLFIDKYDFNEHQIDKYTNLVDNCKSLGYQKDLLAVLENIDLYVNPDRSGGGTSAIYPLFLGKPVVTLNKGDVANNVGREFWVSSYEEMLDKIIKYSTEEEFYNNKSVIARKRALELTDVSQFVKEIYEKAITSSLF